EGDLPHDLTEVDVRQTEIRLTSRNQVVIGQYRKAHRVRVAIASLLKDLPENLRNRADAQLLAAEADEKVCNIVQLVYRARSHEGKTKFNNYSRRTMEEHWQSGYDDAVRSLSHPDMIQLAGKPDGVRTLDINK